METRERTCRSRFARDSGFGHQVATVAHIDVGRTGHGGHESDLAAGYKENASEASQNGLLENVCSQTRV